MKTYTVKAKEIKREWHVIDATDRVLGELATETAKILMGKNKAMFTRNLDTGDYVVVVNASKIKVSGKKLEQKMYYRHSGYPGGFRSVALDEMLSKKPEMVIEHAVKGMLPRNKLGVAMLKKLKIYAGAEHPHSNIAAVKQAEV
ncbi:MAG: 50S ribosomal protein L13 [Dehalococcoidia bacterium]|nr:50S ribosomal protein L13 [Dehalococcoidia bacterium]